MIETTKKVLVLCAHPDDEVLGCGGLIAKLTENGDDVYVIFTTDGVRHPPVCTDSCPDAYEALNVLGVNSTNIFFLGIKTQRSDQYVLRDFTSKVEAIGQDFDLVILPSKDDLNIDHVFAYNLGLICFRPLKRKTKIISMEILSSSEWSDVPFQPNFYIDISNTIEKKLDSLKKYTKQLLQFPHPRSGEAIKIKAKQRGLEVGYKYAEAFKIIRWFE
ncbi:MAG: PIG-L family deacetylase [Nitrospirae bacterium]|nr:PIG-L family deacetylase [Nitrospirota bacterium]